MGNDDARQIDPLNLTGAYIERAMFYKKGRRYEEALADYAGAYNKNARSDKGELDQAIGDFDEALRLNPGNTEALKGLERLREMEQGTDNSEQ